MPDKNQIQQSLYDFDATIKAKPNLTDKELFSKFPEFNNDINKLQAAKDYSATLNSGKYKNVEEFNDKFPEFFTIEKKKESLPSPSLPTQLPSVSPLEEGGKMVGGQVLKEVSKGIPQLPKEGTQTTISQRSEKPKSENQGWLLNTVSALDKGFYKNIIGNPVKGLGTVLEQGTAKITGGSGKGFISDALISFGDYFNKAIDEVTPQDEDYKNSLSDQFGQALGQVASLVMTGGIGGGASKGASAISQAIPKAATTKTALKSIVGGLASPVAVSSGLSLGQSEFDKAKSMGATDEQAFETFYKNAAVGSILEKIPVMQFMKRFNQSTGGGVVNFIKTKGVAGITGGLEEMTTEVLQQLYSNKTAKDVYNVNQDIFEGLSQSGGVGFGVGFLLNAMGANVKLLKKQGKEGEAKLIENQIKQFESKSEGSPSSNIKTVATEIAIKGNEDGFQRAKSDLDKDFQNGVISEQEYQEGIEFAEKAAEINNKIPEIVQGVNRAESIELISERDRLSEEINQREEQKKGVDIAYHNVLDNANKEVQKRIDEINNQLGELAKPEKNKVEEEIQQPIEEQQVPIVEEPIKEEVIVSEPLKDVESTAKALEISLKEGGKIDEDGFQYRNEKKVFPIVDTFTQKMNEDYQRIVFEEEQKSPEQFVSEAYHKAKADGSNPELVKAVEDLLGKPTEEVKVEEKPIVSERIPAKSVSGVEPEAVEGETITTISGKTEQERLSDIERRKKETNVTDKVKAENDLWQSAQSLFNKSKNYLKSQEGLQELNNLRTKARELGFEVDLSRNAIVKKGKAGKLTKLKYNNKADSGTAINESGIVLRDRPKEVQDVFQELNDLGIFLDAKRADDVRMTPEQIEGAIQDIIDGIPSNRANDYLDLLEKAVNENNYPLYDKGTGDINPRIEDIRERLVDREDIGEPMDEETFISFLEEEGKLTPEEEQQLLDNIDNLLTEYETEPTVEAGVKTEIPKAKPTTEERVPAKVEPIAETPKAEPTKVEKKAEVEKTEIEKSYEEALNKKSEKTQENAKTKIIEDNFDGIVSQLMTKNKIKRICE